MNDNDFLSKEELHSTVCKNIKKFRNERGLTQQALSEMIDMSHEYLRQLESSKGQKAFTFYSLYKISVALDVPIDDFINS